jgi:predicted AlkP superfamily pyrophosphatase or phosphodiesterase
VNAEGNLRNRILLKTFLPLAASALLALPALTQQPGPPPAQPKLIVLIVVDQMRADYVERFRDRWHGGLRRLVDQGAWLRNAAYPYTVTETCPGHSTVSTGVFPATHGIVGNTWWDRQASSRVACTEDVSVRNVGTSRAAPAGDSAVRLLAPSLAEQLRASIPESRVVTLSVKARSAAMLAGHRADASLWFDETTGELLTSTAYAMELPRFARQFIDAHPVAADFSQVWQLSAPAESYAGGRSVLGEGPPPGWTTSFPHALAAGDKAPGPAFVARWRTSPFADAYLAHLAEAAVDELKLGGGRGVDFLGIGFSATDYVGHAFGPDSREVEDDLLVLDKTIGELLEKLDRNVGAGKYVVALTADHGVAPIPEQAKLQGRDAGRVDLRDIVDRIEKAMSEKLGQGRYVAQFVPPDVYFAAGVAARVDSDPNLWRAVQQAALAEPGVANVIRRGRPGPAPVAAKLARAVALDMYPERSGDVWIGLKPGWVPSARTAGGWSGGTTHGSGNEYDQRVPIILFGAGIKRGQYTPPATPADIAPTLAAISGVRIARTDGRVLREALATPQAASAR